MVLEPGGAERLVTDCLVDEACAAGLEPSDRGRLVHGVSVAASAALRVATASGTLVSGSPWMTGVPLNPALHRVCTISGQGHVPVPGRLGHGGR